MQLRFGCLQMPGKEEEEQLALSIPSHLSEAVSLPLCSALTVCGQLDVHWTCSSEKGERVWLRI